LVETKIGLCPFYFKHLKVEIGVTYTIPKSENVHKSELDELENLLKQNMIFFLKTDDPDDAFDLGLNGDLTIKLNYLNN
jgi:hypothetical protein